VLPERYSTTVGKILPRTFFLGNLTRGKDRETRNERTGEIQEDRTRSRLEKTMNKTKENGKAVRDK
jgi:hypothetical protein